MKSHSLLPILAAGILSGAAAGALAGSLLKDSAPERPAAQPTPGDTADLRAELERLAAENQELRDEVRAVLRAPQPATREVAGDWATVQRLEEVRDELLARIEAEGSLPAAATLSPENPRFEESVEEVILNLRKEESLDKIRQYQEKRTARLDRDLDKMRDWLELSEGQVGDMRTVLTAQYDRETELTARWEAGEDEELLGEQKAADRETFYREVNDILRVDQAERFWESVGGGKGD